MDFYLNNQSYSKIEVFEVLVKFKNVKERLQILFPI